MTLRAIAIAASLVISASAAGAGSNPAPLMTPGETREVPQTRAEITLSFSPVVKQAAPAVVNIYTRKVVQRRASPFADDPFFQQFFKDMFPGGGLQRRIESSLGSGVIVDAEGIVVSNHHVVGDADEITVVLQDRREFQGKVILADKESDLAIVQLEGATSLPTLTLRDSDTLEVGDLVLAIGNPFGVGQTVTSGIVSGLARTSGARGGGFFIQTDAAINPGNSGGALVDMQGRLVGVNTAILSRSGGSNGIGFAVPANLVARVIELARSGETGLVRPWLGIAGQEVTGELASAMGLDAPRGIAIEDLHAASPLRALGMKRGDVIVEIDRHAVNTLEELEFRIATKPLGKAIAIVFLRNGERRDSHVTLAAAPEQPPRDVRRLERADGLPGLTVMNVNPAVIDELDLPTSTTGVLALDVRGAARRVGLRRGDLIAKVDGKAVATVAELVERLRQTRGDTVLDVRRNGRTGQIRYRR